MLKNNVIFANLCYLIFLIPANLYSKEDLPRQEAATACLFLARQCSDAGALENLLQHFFGVFHGSEGKLTVTVHKTSVLQVISVFYS